MTDLHELLDLATDRVEPTGLAPGALATARRRRRNRRGVAVAGVVAAGVLAVGVVNLAVDRSAQDTPIQPLPAPLVPDEPPERWDPSRADELPAAAVDVAPLLPDLLRVPDVAPRIEDEPMEAAVLSVDDDADILLLDEGGRWHCVVVADRTSAAPVLSPDGTRLAVQVAYGVVVIDLTTGRRQTQPGWPDFEEPWSLGSPAVRGPAGWTVRPAVELGDGTGLLQVAPSPRHPDPDRWWLVHWDPATDEWSLVARADADPGKAVSFAADLVSTP